jgi:hypothetical protein
LAIEACGPVSLDDPVHSTRKVRVQESLHEREALQDFSANLATDQHFLTQGNALRLALVVHRPIPPSLSIAKTNAFTGIG